MSIEDLKNNIPDILKNWADGRIDNLVRSNPRLSTASVYIKRGIKNYIDRESEAITRMLDNASLFLLEDGKLDADAVFNDLMNVLNTMPETEFRTGIVRGTIGNGAVRFLMPDGLFWSILLGDTGAIKLTTDDFSLLRDLVKSTRV